MWNLNMLYDVIQCIFKFHNTPLSPVLDFQKKIIIIIRKNVVCYLFFKLQIIKRKVFQKYLPNTSISQISLKAKFEYPSGQVTFFNLSLQKMTYCPWTRQVVVNTAGMVFFVNLLSLKHKVPSNLFFVLETQTEKPRKLDLYWLSGPSYEIKDVVNMINQSRINSNNYTKIRCKKETILKKI